MQTFRRSFVDGTPLLHMGCAVDSVTCNRMCSSCHLTAPSFLTSKSRKQPNEQSSGRLGLRIDQPEIEIDELRALPETGARMRCFQIRTSRTHFPASPGDGECVSGSTRQGPWRLVRGHVDVTMEPKPWQRCDEKLSQHEYGASSGEK
jgi:hypothetical protein